MKITLELKKHEAKFSNGRTTIETLYVSDVLLPTVRNIHALKQCVGTPLYEKLGIPIYADNGKLKPPSDVRLYVSVDMKTQCYAFLVVCMSGDERVQYLYDAMTIEIDEKRLQEKTDQQ